MCIHYSSWSKSSRSKSKVITVCNFSTVYTFHLLEMNYWHNCTCSNWIRPNCNCWKRIKPNHNCWKLISPNCNCWKWIRPNCNCWKRIRPNCNCWKLIRPNCNCWKWMRHNCYCWKLIRPNCNWQFQVTIFSSYQYPVIKLAKAALWTFIKAYFIY